MVKEHFEDFTYLRPFHLLLDADTYEHYLNVNTLNPRNLKESGHLCAVCDESKPFLKRRQYTFEEVKLFSEAKSRYVRLYHLLAYPKSNDRLRVIREMIKRGCLPKDLEEDRLLPIMQIGESLGHTCLSYRDGKYKKCLLSCFDANKKVLYVSYDGQLVFRAMIRLTKGAFSGRPRERQNMQFADIIQEDMADGTEGRKKEYLTLFLERPYFKGISEDKEKEVVNLAVGMLQKKAKQLQAELVLSDSYRKLILEEKKFIRAKYYMYISASKNGKQYLDSLGGMANVQDEGSYEEGYFLLQESFVNPKTGEQ